MSRLLRLFLLFGAVIGLLGQEAAFAAGPAIVAETSAVSQAPMSSDCAEMMKQQAPDESPCKGLTLDCIAKMGCSATIALMPPAAQPIQLALPTALVVPIPVAVMASLTLLPDKQPPKLLI